MGVVLSYVLILHVTMHYVLTSAILVLGTTMTQSIIFIPKVGAASGISKVNIGTVKPRVEAAASMQVRSPVRLIGLAQSQGHLRVFATTAQ